MSIEHHGVVSICEQKNRSDVPLSILCVGNRTLDSSSVVSILAFRFIVTVSVSPSAIRCFAIAIFNRIQVPGEWLGAATVVTKCIAISEKLSHSWMLGCNGSWEFLGSWGDVRREVMEQLSKVNQPNISLSDPDSRVHSCERIVGSCEISFCKSWNGVWARLRLYCLMKEDG